MSEQTLSVRFFARLREELGTEHLTMPAPAGQTAADLLTTLANRGGPWVQLNTGQPVMIAINQAMAKPQSPVKPGDEVAFFPPVTGG
jgi:molybdopterin synthase sulfur carrier subunit